VANITVTNTFSNGTAADASQVNTNFTDIINGTSDGTKDFSISALTCAGTATLNGNVIIGNASADDLTITASVASTIAYKTTGLYNIGAATLAPLSVYFGNASNSNTARILGGVTSSSYTMTLPLAVSAAHDALVSNDATGTLIFRSISSSSQLENLTISASVSANALTVALKTKAAADATATTPIFIGTRSSTAATGTYNTRTVTGALNITISSGSTLGLASGSLAQYVYVYAIDNASTIELALSGNSYFDESSVLTTTVLAGGGGDDSGILLYSTTARAGVAARLLGRLKFTLTTAGTWDEAPDEISLAPFSTAMPRSEIIVDTGNGHGSGSTKIRRLTNVRKSVGNAITYTTSADTSVLGSVFTVNENGIFAITYTDVRTDAGTTIGLSVNSGTLTTNIGTVTYANGRRSIAGSGGATIEVVCCWTGNLVAGDVVRPHTTGSVQTTTDTCMFTIAKVGN